MAPKRARNMVQLEGHLVDPFESEGDNSPPPKRRGRPRSKPNNKVVPKPSNNVSLLEGGLVDPFESEGDNSPPPRRRGRPRLSLREEALPLRPQPSPKATKKEARKAPQSNRSKILTQESSSDSEELPRDLFASKTRSKPLKSTTKGGGKSTCSDEDVFESRADEESSNSSSEDSLPKTKKNKGKGIAPPSDDEMLDVVDGQLSETGSISTEWTEEDQILLDCTYDYELSLWRKTKSIFNCTPFDLFPKGIKAATGHWDGYRYGDRFIKNETSLTIPLCKSLCTLVCFPWFHGDIGYVKYALSSALKARCGENTPLIEEGTSCWTSFESECEGLFNDMNDAELFLSDDQLETLKKLLSFRTSLLGPGSYSTFLDSAIFEQVLASTRTAKEAGDSIHLLNGDVQNVIKAWDVWNKDAKKYLPSMEDSRHSWHKANNKVLKVPKAIVLGWKKDWILKNRLDAANKLGERSVRDDDDEGSRCGDDDNGVVLCGDDDDQLFFGGDDDGKIIISSDKDSDDSDMDSLPQRSSNDVDSRRVELDDLPLENILTPDPASLSSQAQDPSQPYSKLSKENANSNAKASGTIPTTQSALVPPATVPTTQSAQVLSTTSSDKVNEKDIKNYLKMAELKDLAVYKKIEILSEDNISMEKLQVSYPPRKIPDVLYQIGYLQDDFEPHEHELSGDVSIHIKASTTIESGGLPLSTYPTVYWRTGVKELTSVHLE
ncbi:hypothetical protein H4I95_05070 [Botrytis cinerea]